MKKLIHIGFIMLTCILLHSCSADEPLLSDSEKKTANNGKPLYLSVDINILGDGCDYPATRGEDGGFADGTDFPFSTSIQHEKGVYNARFMFYDEDGNFVGNVDLSHDEVEDLEDTSATDPTGNVEYKSHKILLLQDFATTPTYVATLLNYRSKYFTKANMPASLQKLSKYTVSVYDYNAPDNEWYYTMFTSSYENGEVYPFVTRIDPKYFHPSKDEAEIDDPLQIYVERVCAKICVDKDIPKEVYTYTSNSVNFDAYKLGDDVRVHGWGDSPVYVVLYGWENSVEPKYNTIPKLLNTAWTNEYLGFDWNDPTNHRSYWGTSYYYQYGSATRYPDHYDPSVASSTYYNEYTTFGRPDNSSTLRLSYNRFCSDYRNETPHIPRYVRESTHNLSVQTKYFPSCTPCVVIKAQICYMGADGKLYYPTEIIRYKGELYTDDAFKQMILDDMKATGKLDNIRNGSFALNTAAFYTVDDPYLNGRVKLESDDLVLLNDTLGNVLDVSVLNNILAEYTDNSPANGYAHGYMYYNVPVEHFGSWGIIRNDDGSIKYVTEGSYGMVRNHWYQLTIKDITHVGVGVENTSEPIIPNREDEDVWRIKATCKVMPWHKESQTINFNKKTK